jgi:hypothetical protein
MVDNAELGTKLAAVLQTPLGAGTSVDNLRALTGGASRTTWAFEAVTDGQRHSLILRTGPPDDVHAGMELEAHAQAAAAAAGAIRSSSATRSMARPSCGASNASLTVPTRPGPVSTCYGNAPRRWPQSTGPTRTRRG